MTIKTRIEKLEQAAPVVKPSEEVALSKGERCARLAAAIDDAEQTGEDSYRARSLRALGETLRGGVPGGQ